MSTPSCQDLATQRQRFLAIAAIEPMLLQVEEATLAAARTWRSHESRLRWWYGVGHLGGKEQMARLVGHGRCDAHAILGTPAAYDVAYAWLQRVLHCHQARQLVRQSGRDVARSA